ncbi:MAG: DinB family protein [Acidobacteriia bacterium]|nr:DinB family protein [Terriglobia bacterium]
MAQLSLILLEKIQEQVERIQHLLSLIPPDRLDWRPQIPVGASAEPHRVDELLGHLLECLAGFCAVLYKAHPDRLSHFGKLRELPVNHRCRLEEAKQRIDLYQKHIAEGLALVSDEDLQRKLPTVFVPSGEPLLTLLLGNLEHLINHKHQLFWYLKLLGAPVRTPDLYHVRGT